MNWRSFSYFASRSARSSAVSLGAFLGDFAILAFLFLALFRRELLSVFHQKPLDWSAVERCDFGYINLFPVVAVNGIGLPVTPGKRLPPIPIVILDRLLNQRSRIGLRVSR